MDKILASDAQGALSENGTGSNPAFALPARVGDVATLTIAPPDGKEHADFALIGTAGGVPSAAVGLSLDGETYCDGDAGLPVGAFRLSVLVYVKAQAECVLPGIQSEYEGFTDIVSATGDAGSGSGASGAAVDVEVEAGSAASAGTGTGAAKDVEAVSGVADSDSSASGAPAGAIDVKTVSGDAASASSAGGGETSVSPVTGAAASTSGGLGAAAGVTRVTSTVPIAADAMIYSPAPDTNRGDVVNMVVGDDDSNASTAYHGLIKGDLASASPSIPSNAIIDAVRVKLYNYFAENGGTGPATRTVSLYRLLRAWTELGVTWNKYNGTNAWGTAGGENTTSDRSSTVSAAATIGAATNAYVVFSGAQLVADVQAFVNSTLTNNGWLLKADSELCGVAPYSSSYFYTRDNATSKPIIEIDWHTP